MNATDLTEQQRSDILRKLNKLLQTKGTTEAEASSRIAKAQELLATYNLTMDDVERAGDDGGKRAEEKLEGGFYLWERSLWIAVAELNFCWCIPWYDWVEMKRFNRAAGRTRVWWRKKRQFRIIGRQVNIAATKAMAGYIVQTCNRLALERLHGDARQQLGSWAVSFREGIAARVQEKLTERRHQYLSEERAKQRAAEKMAMQGHSTATGVTLAKLSRSEADANNDFVMGEGWTAAQAAARAERATWRRMDEQQRTAWAAANPEEAQRQAARDRSEARARNGRGRAPRERYVSDPGAYRAGYEAGEHVGIDMQASQRKAAGALV